MKGWIFDLYPGAPGEMVVWMKDGQGRAHRLVDPWSPSLFVASGDRELLGSLASGQDVRRYASRVDFVQRKERITDSEKSEVLRVTVRDAGKLIELARRIESVHAFGKVRIYNCDVPPAQSYLYDNDLFPLAFCEVVEGPYGLRWRLEDERMEYDYVIPPMRTMTLGIRSRRSGLIAKVSDPIEEVWLAEGDGTEGRETMGGATEKEKICGLIERVRGLDLDILLTRDGDSFLFPYLIERAEKNGVAEELVLGRDPVPLKRADRPGFSYFSYGKIFFKPSSVRLYGRLHLDVSSSFSHSHSGMWGLFEISRVCIQPLHTSSRSSIGKALSSLQFYHATKREILIPWKPVLAERFKRRSELLVADRGGFICDPLAGVYDSVAEFDYCSLYPNIMLKKNISAETVKCGCCPGLNPVPELGWNVCKERGITSQTMEIIVKKRLEYKRRRRDIGEGGRNDRYAGCQDALKWLGVTCLPSDARVFVKMDGKEKCAKIGDFIDGLVGDRTGVIECPPDVFVAGLDSGLKAGYSRVGHLVKKPNVQRLLRIKMEDGREVVSTPDHPFFILRTGELEVEEARKLGPGDLIPVAKRTPKTEMPVRDVDLIEKLSKDLSHEEQLLWRVYGEVLKAAVERREQDLVKEAVSEGYTAAAVRVWIKTGMIPLRFLNSLDVPKELHNGLQIGTGRREGGRVAWLPAVLPVDERLGFFLGLFVADGSATRTYVRLDIGLVEPDLLESARITVQSVFGVQPRVYREKDVKMHVVQVNNASLVRVLDRVFGLPGSAERGKLRVPEVIFNCDERTSNAFLAGLVAGDGSISKNRKFISIATASKELQTEIGFLAAKLGLAFRLSKNREGLQQLYTVNFVGPETLARVRDWDELKGTHRVVADAWRGEEEVGTCNHARYERLPATESGLYTLSISTRTSSEPHLLADGRTCPVQVAKKITRIKSRSLEEGRLQQLSRLERLVNSDVGFVRVTHVEELDSCPEYVYCFQMDEAEIPGFFTGEGLVYVHNCFGYLGFNNAKFGRIDAHIAVCAWDREVLLRSVRTAEREGFQVIHGIVDSLWLRKKGATERDYEDLKGKMEAETGFELSFEGIYKWIAFLNSKTSPHIAVQNRYFGCYEKKGLKTRGIESRRHDTPQFFRDCQDEILGIMKDAGSVEEVKATIPACVDAFRDGVERMRRREIPVEEMVFTKNISKDPHDYRNDTLEAEVVKALLEEGAALHQGEGISYVITDFYSGATRAIPADALDGERCYDVRRYAELLAEACSTLMRPFDARMTPRGLLDTLATTSHLTLA